MTINKKINVLIPAAGKGSRSGLNYPKTLFKVEGKEILLSILELVKDYDPNPTIIISPDGEKLIKNFLASKNKKANLVIQEKPTGMGNAILQYKKSSNYKMAKNILLIWGDIPFIRSITIAKLVKSHFQNKNDFTLITKEVQKAYTLIKRDIKDNIIDIIETREFGLKPEPGEREIGLFLFKKEIIMDLLSKDKLSNKFGKETGEHGFLYVIKHLAILGKRIEGLKIANDKELKSLNSISDLI